MRCGGVIVKYNICQRGDVRMKENEVKQNRILIVEDEISIAKMISMNLKVEHYFFLNTAIAA